MTPDLKLSARLLIKYPGLTLAAGLGIMTAVAICGGFFAFLQASFHPRLGLDESDRIVALQNYNVAINRRERRSIHDLASWRREMTTVVEISAFRNVDGRLSSAGEAPAPVRIAEMTASAFRVARVAPLLGRSLLDDDEREAAPPVLVIGHDVWRTRFGQAPSVVGQQVRIGETVHTIVGVMPERYGFPLNHQYWRPLRLNPLAIPRGEGPEIYVFGRLAPGATWEMAKAELAAIGRNAATAFPRTHGPLRPRLLPYTYPLYGVDEEVAEWSVVGVQLTISLLLIVVALNVTILVYARTAMRRTEFAVRMALGASRGRIVGQLFVEAFVLALVPALAGLALAQTGLRLGNLMLAEEKGGVLPFWTDNSLQPETALYILGLVVVTAAIVGILPALHATRTTMRLGRMWTALVVAQVAVAIAVLPAAVKVGLSEIKHTLTRPTYPAENFVQASLGVDVAPLPIDEVMERLRERPDVAGVTFVARSARAPLQVDGAAAAALVRDVVSMGVGDRYFDVYGVRILEGRGFAPQDDGGAASAVIVNRSFVRKVFGTGSAVGRRVRDVAITREGKVAEVQSAPWRDIVGVVENLQANPIDEDSVRAMMFSAVPSARVTTAALLAVRLRSPAAPSFGGALQAITSAVDPRLRLDDIQTGARVDRQEQIAVRLVGLVVSLLLVTVFVLSAGGVYALMSFTVARRRKEIGIRTALGARPAHLLGSVFRRVAVQIALGVAVGLAAALGLDSITADARIGGATRFIIPAIALIMSVVGLLAAYGPVRRGLRIEPIEVLRAE